MKKKTALSCLSLFTAVCLTALGNPTPVLEFSGAPNAIALADSLIFPANTPFSVEYWLRSSNPPGTKADYEYAIIWSKDGANHAFRHYPWNWVQRADDTNTSRNYGTLNSGVVFTTIIDFYFKRNLDNGKWVHFAMTRDSGNQILVYVDGNLIEDGSWDNSGGVWNGELRFDRIGNLHEGSVADIRVWDHVRSATEIELNRYRRLAGSEEGLLGYWPLDDGAGSTVRDVTSAGNDGTITSAVWSSDPEISLVASDTDFTPSSPIQVADQVTGSEEFTNSDRVQVVSFPVPPSVDQFQMTFSADPDSLDQTPGAWSSTAPLPEELILAQPSEDGDMCFYVWFRDSGSPESLRCAQGKIRYSTAAPVAVAHSSLSRETAGYTVRLLPEELDKGSDGGTSDGTDIPIYKMEVVAMANPASDLTPGEDFGTLPATAGEYTFALKVINAAGNHTISAPCTVELTTTTSLPSGDHYVAVGNLNAVHPYSSWTTAAADIQTAVNATGDNEKLLVARGTYHGSGAQIVNITRPLELIGAYPHEEVILDGGGGAFGNRRGIIATMPAPGSGMPEMLIENLTVQNCVVTEEMWGGSGVGIRLRFGDAPSGTITVRNCIVTGNHKVGSNVSGPYSAGAGIGASGVNGSEFDVIISGCLVTDNHTHARQGDGAGIHLRYGKFTLEKSIMSSNQVHGLRWHRPDTATHTYVSNGGGLCLSEVTPGSIVRYCEFIGNGGTTLNRGSAILGEKCSATIENSICRFNEGVGTIFYDAPGETNLIRSCLVANNGRGMWPGIALYQGSHAIIENCTVAENIGTSGGVGGGNGLASYYESTSMKVSNSIVYDNYPNNFYPPSRVLFDHSCTTPAADGDGNITAAPLFADAAAGDFRLQSASPCRNTGRNMSWMTTARDLDGKRRIDANGTVDMGCYEHHSLGSLILLR